MHQPSPWRLEDERQSTELTSIIDADGNYVAQWVHKRNHSVILAAPAMLEALRFIRNALKENALPQVVAAVNVAIEEAEREPRATLRDAGNQAGIAGLAGETLDVVAE